MPISRLDQAIQRYKAALVVLSPNSKASEFNLPQELSTLEVLDILTARDEVQVALERSTQRTGAQLTVIYQLDKLLKENAKSIAQIREAASESADWRDSFHSREDAWWWALEAPKPVQWTERFDWLWGASSVTCLTISLGLLVNIYPRFLSGGPDVFAALTTVAQTVATLLAAGGTLTKTGQEALQRIANKVGISRRYRHELGTGLSLLVLLSAFWLWLSLPRIAEYYTSWGWNNYQSGNWSSAEEDYKRALQLNPDDAQAHFYLGRLYEDLQNLDAARAEYNLALQGSDVLAYNNLARLNLLKGNHSAAVTLLLKGLKPAKDKQLPPETKYLLLKNLGWARLLQKDHAGAEAQLKKAIKLKQSPELRGRLKENVAAPHCLLAQALQAQNKKKDAQEQWETCVSLANRGNPDEDSWVILSDKYLIPEETKK